MVFLHEFKSSPQSPSTLRILVGSQTGNGELLASILSKELYRRSVISTISLLSEYNISELVEEKLVVFIVSTFGQGEPPLMMKKLWSVLMRKDISSSSLSGVSYSVFGLGDSSYQKFNYVSKILDHRLECLGAIRILPRGEGDEQDPVSGIRKGFSIWMKSLFSFLNVSHAEPMSQLTSKFHTIIVDGRSRCKINAPHENLLQLTRVSRLTPVSHFQNVSTFTFSSKSRLSYRPGDILKIYPKNSDEDVQYVLSFFGIDNLRDELISEITSLRPDATIPTHVNRLLKTRETLSVEDFLKSIVHISNCSPDQVFFENLYMLLKPLLGRVPTVDLWIEKFRELSEDYEEYLYYCYRPKRRIIDILHEFSVSSEFSPNMLGDGLSVDCLFEIFPWIVPRQFSISSAMEKNPHDVSITAAIVEYPIGRSVKRGYCSAFLESLNVGSHIVGHLEANVSALTFPGFTLGEIVSPIILLCSGTGIAPMRAFLELCYVKMLENSLPPIKIYLAFGCRYRQKDALYLDSEEFLSLIRHGILTLFCKGSRDGPQHLPKIYLQNIITENGELFKDLIIHHSARVYLCGNTKLPKAVRESISNLIGIDHMKRLESEGRFQIECW